MGQKIININPDKVVIPKDLYPRRRVPVETDVQHLRGLGGNWHTKIVTANGGKTLVDGAHRLLAAQLDGIKSLEALDIGKADSQTVLKEACQRNATHGKQLTMAEKQDMAVKLVGDNTATELCDLLGVADRTMSRWLADAKDERKVRVIAKARKLLDKGKSMTKVAKECGVARGTLQGWLKTDDEAPAEDPTPKASGKSSTTSSSTPTTSPEVQAINRMTLLAETNALIDMTATGIVAECKAAVKGENPDGLHWSDFAKLVLNEIERQYPKAAKVA